MRQKVPRYLCNYKLANKSPKLDSMCSCGEEEGPGCSGDVHTAYNIDNLYMWVYMAHAHSTYYYYKYKWLVITYYR